MFTTAREVSGLPGQHWSAGWDTPASVQLTSSLVQLHTRGKDLFCFSLDFFVNVHFYPQRNAAKPVLCMIRLVLN